MNGTFDWCNLGQHTGCPGLLPEDVWPDPTRPGKFYSLPGRSCACSCHKRPTLKRSKN